MIRRVRQFVAAVRYVGKILPNFARILGEMTNNPSKSQAVLGLARPLLVPVLLVAALGGCDALNSARNDLSKLTTSRTSPAPARTAPATTARTTPSKAATTPAQQTAALNAAGSVASTPVSPLEETPPSLIGRSEIEVQALYGQPSSTEDRPPGKVWHYRDGTCALDVRLFPDVQTRQFGTLSYEVKSDDNSDQGKRACLAQLRARATAQR
jgi:hypothetical protein